MGNKLKKIGYMIAKVMWLVFILASINNMVKRIQSANKAVMENKKIEEEIRFLKENNIKLEQNIRYASSSAFVEAAARQYFGLGDPNDYWLKLPDMSVDSEFEEIKTETDVRNWEKWLNLFTKGM